MRFVALILSFIVFVMAILPCTDSIFTNVNEVTNTEICDTHQEHSEDVHDECTPLCTCNCCGTSITLPLLITFQDNHINIYDNSCYFYSYHYHYKFAKGLWHPPNIS
ncbi:DUF6660 family protein [Wenyingzhuangia fucanilytica]|uniref:DUF6660 family protein n=1 Tax=Wenyingzhuangia fucanilytica TaxID=1790137 RepID=UPI003AB54002